LCEGSGTNADGRVLDRVKESEVRTEGEAVNWSAVIEDRTDEGVIKGNEYLSIATCNGVCEVFEHI